MVVTGPNPDDAKIEPSAETVFKAEVELVTTHDLSLGSAGAGKAQILLWVTLMNIHQDKVVFMDEPDLHLPPRLPINSHASFLSLQLNFSLFLTPPIWCPRAVWIWCDE
ncbi:MAG: hypothetical protein M1294_08740 [Firmicutes bacterium]|jgi:hypothetical protein|nr:hypothetical protein [Bacillota bacterium]